MNRSQKREQTTQKLDEAVSLIVSNVLAEREAKTAGGKRASAANQWENERTGRLGRAVRRQIIAECLRFVRYNKKWTNTAIGEALFANTPMSGRPTRKSGPDAGKKWDAESYVSWLGHKNSPAERDEEQTLRTFVDLLFDKRPSDEPRDELYRLVEEVHPIEVIVRQILTRFDLSRSPQWIAPNSYVPTIKGAFSAKAASPEYMNSIAKEAKEFLSKVEGPRTFFVVGPMFSGKKTALAYFLERCEEGYLRLADGTRLPIFATSISDVAPIQFVDDLYEFMTSAHGARRQEHGALLEHGVRWKIEQIASMAANTPGCFVLANKDGVERDEMLRALSQDYVSEAVTCLLRGHRLTRILITSSDALGQGRILREAKRLCDHSVVKSLRPSFALAEVLGTNASPSRDDKSVEISGDTWRLSQIAEAFAQKQIVLDRERKLFERQRELLLRRNDQLGLCTLIWDKILSPPDQEILGVIATCPDGLRASVLERILAAMQKTESANKKDNSDRPAMGELSNLFPLIESHEAKVHPSLCDRGEPSEETNYIVGRAWRHHFLRLWCLGNRERARQSHWLLARESTDQSRRLRVHEADSNAGVTVSRDLLTVHALIAAADPASIISMPSATEYGLLSMESQILPPLNVDAPFPDSRSMLSYAYRYLYRTEIEGNDYRLITKGDDAATRLGILLPLFAPETPWIAVTDRKLSGSWRPYGHLLATFTSAEVMELLVSVALAAVRIQDDQLTSTVARLAEQLFAEKQGRCIKLSSYMRVLRAEVDAGIFLGGNPDAMEVETAGSQTQSGGRSYDIQMTDVASRLRALVEGQFSVPELAETEDLDRLTAAGKLYARLAEVYCYAGRWRLASQAFDRAMSIEDRLISLLPTGSVLTPVLGGRGVRRRIKFLLDTLRNRNWSSKDGIIIFRDELALLLHRKVDKSLSEWAKARRLFNINARRCSRARANDSFGIKMDAAHFAAAHHEFAYALRVLDEAEATTRFSSGTNLELTLEFFVTRTRVAIDAAILCFQCYAEAPVFESTEEVEGLRRYLEVGEVKNSGELGEELMGIARRSKARLDALIELQPQRAYPCRIQAAFLEALLLAVSTRRHHDLPDRRRETEIENELLKVDELLAATIDDMRGFAYLEYLWEARRLQRGVRAALAYYKALGAAAVAAE